MSFQSNAFQNDAFQIDVGTKPAFRRVWIPDKKELIEDAQKAKEFLRKAEDVAEGIDDIEGYQQKLGSSIKQFKESGFADGKAVYYEERAKLRLQQILMSIEVFEDGIMEVLALLLLVNEI